MLNRRRVVSVPSSRLVIEKRLEAFAPCYLPVLSTGSDTDKVPVEVSVTGSSLYHPAKTNYVIIFLCLNIGNDPPDHKRVEPCARLECWIDPHMAPVSGGAAGGCSEYIVKKLERQYMSLSVAPTFRKATEVCLAEAKHLMSSARQRADKGRVLLHYNGHGMPKATSYGEIWFFDKNRTHYVPLNISEIAHLVGSPTIYVLDCNSAGSILQFWYRQCLYERHPHDILICACDSKSFLPLNPQLPADVLTSCLTTPLQMALEWYISYSHCKHLLPHVTAEMIRNIPGDISNYDSPLGELNKILVAVTDTIAWCTSTPSQFYVLFRQDNMTASLLRNFFLADRLLREVRCVPVSHPPISEEAHLHHAWDLWEYTLENVVSQLPDLLTSELRVNPDYKYKSSTFFMDQLLAFEVWIENGNLENERQPEELPSVLLALTQPSYCVPALALLVKYLDSGMNAGSCAINCGIIPYAGNLLESNQEVFLIVSILWMQLLRADEKQCTNALFKWRLGNQFIRILELDVESIDILEVEDVQTVISHANGARADDNAADLGMLPVPATKGDGEDNCTTSDAQRPCYYLMKELDLHRCKTIACYILCQLLKGGGEKMCIACWNNKLLNAAFLQLGSSDAELCSWSCLVLAQLFLSLRHARNFAAQECTKHFDLFTYLLDDKFPIVRSSCVTLLASLVGSSMDYLSDKHQVQVRYVQMEKSLFIKLRSFIYDASMSVREELIFFACRVLFHYGSLVAFLHPNANSTSNRYMEYVRNVGKNSPKWVLGELDVHIRSQLSASRPTVNSRFDQFVVFDSGKLEFDDPAPPAASVSMGTISPEVLIVLQGMVHDAALMLFTLYQTCDTGKVAAAIDDLAKGIFPQSNRFANEALRSMSCVVSTDSLGFLSEADRARSIRNMDLMRQLVLDMQERKLEPFLLPSSKSKALKTDNGGAVMGEGGGTYTTAFTRYQVLPSLIYGDQVICATFRALELDMVLATKNQFIYHSSYETYSSQTYVHKFSASFAAPLHDVLVINDLSEHAGLLLVNKRGGFSLVKDCWKEMPGTPTEVAKFSACSPKGTMDIKSVYKSYNAHLFYGGPIGTNGDTEIHVLSLDREQVIQRLTVSGGSALTSLTAQTTGCAVFAGCSDGVVRYYDDRQKEGLIALLGLLHAEGSSSRHFNNVETIVGAGPVEAGGAGLMIATATRNAVRIYDTRKAFKLAVEVDLSTLCGACGKWPSVQPKLLSISAFETGIHTGLLGVLFSDCSYTALNIHGRPLFDKPLKVHNAHGGLSSEGFAVHPLRPLMSVGGEILSIH